MLYLPKQMINWAEIRKQFPVTEHSTYLNTAAAGPLPSATSNAASDYYRLMMNDGDTHWHDRQAKREEVRNKVA
jgi:selenocysteine lyase/cysteine desulfurase